MGVGGEGLLPEVSWDLVNILNRTRRGLCESWDFKIINQRKEFRDKCSTTPLF